MTSFIFDGGPATSFIKTVIHLNKKRSSSENSFFSSLDCLYDNSLKTFFNLLDARYAQYQQCKENTQSTPLKKLTRSYYSPDKATVLDQTISFDFGIFGEIERYQTESRFLPGYEQVLIHLESDSALLQGFGDFSDYRAFCHESSGDTVCTETYKGETETSSYSHNEFPIFQGILKSNPLKNPKKINTPTPTPSPSKPTPPPPTPQSASGNNPPSGKSDLTPFVGFVFAGLAFREIRAWRKQNQEAAPTPQDKRLSKDRVHQIQENKASGWKALTYTAVAIASLAWALRRK